MTRRERELAERHHEALVAMRDDVWRNLSGNPDVDISKRMPQYEALKFAADAVRALLDAPEPATAA